MNMQTGPIFRALAKHKTRLILIATEVALTLAVVVNCVNMARSYHRQMTRPSGVDEENILCVESRTFSPEFRDPAYRDQSRKADLSVLRAIPGVRAAEAIEFFPSGGSGNGVGYKPLHAETNRIRLGTFRAGIDVLDALGVRLLEGRKFTPSDVTDSPSKNVIITKTLAERLFPEGHALGRRIQERTADDPETIVGVIEDMQNSWPKWVNRNHVMLFPEPPGWRGGVRYVVRAEPGRIGGVIKLAEERLLRLGQGRNIEIQTLTEIRTLVFTTDVALVKMLGVLTILLVSVTAFGVVGVTSFSVAERVRQIGTRRALGARKIDVVRYFLVENSLVSLIGIGAGAVLACGLNYVLVNSLDEERLALSILAIGALVIWAVGLLSALGPAWRAARLSPATAARTV